MLTLGNMIGGGEDIENKQQLVHGIFTVQLRTAWGKSRGVLFSTKFGAYVQIDFICIGEFGDVYKGKLTKPNKKKITVAVKTLKVFKL